MLLALSFSDWTERAAGWLLTSGVRVLAVALAMAVALAVVRRAAARLEAVVRGRLPSFGQGGRAATLSRVVRDTARTAVWVVGGLVVLGEVGIDVKPLLAAAGIGGLAIGFGAQSLVKDLISGFFLLFDDRLRVGDVAEVAGVSGVVEDIRLRTIALRDLAGSLHIVPNGSIERVKNMTREYAFAVLDVQVAYREDPDDVVRALEAVGRELAAAPAFRDRLLAPLEVLGVEDLGASGVSIRFRLKTTPGDQWAVGRETRRRVKKAFDARGIEIPFPQQTVWFGVPKDGAAPALRVVSAAEGSVEGLGPGPGR
jgi:small conductance mechanosensitive channel